MVGRREDVIHPFKQGDVVVLVDKKGNPALSNLHEGDEFVVIDLFEQRDWQGDGGPWTSFVRLEGVGFGFYSRRFALKRDTVPEPVTPWWESSP